MPLFLLPNPVSPLTWIFFSRRGLSTSTHRGPDMPSYPNSTPAPTDHLTSVGFHLPLFSFNTTRHMSTKQSPPFPNAPRPRQQRAALVIETSETRDAAASSGSSRTVTFHTNSSRTLDQKTRADRDISFPCLPGLPGHLPCPLCPTSPTRCGVHVYISTSTRYQPHLDP